jgi:glycosyltransferase involved in cell wall biosynthesis
MPISLVERRIRVSRLSAIVITKNEAAKIADCLDSLSFCDERIVVDCGSEDDTVRVARDHGARVEHHAFEGFGAQKNFALSLASGEWVLSIDADERVSPALAAEITTAIGERGADGYEMPRSSSFLGRAMRHSGWYPDYVLRLFRRGRARFSDHIVHERVVCEGPVRRLQEPLLHFPVDRIEEALSRVDRYSSAGAEQMVASGRRVTFASGFLHGFWTFVRTYVFRAGFLDGREGLLLAIANAEGAYYRYMKAWLLTRQGNHARSRDGGGAIRS